WTLWVSASSLVNRTVWPSATAWTLGTNCKPRWFTSATAAGDPAAGRTPRPPPTGSSVTTAGLTPGVQTSGIITLPETSAALAAPGPVATAASKPTAAETIDRRAIVCIRLVIGVRPWAGPSTWGRGRLRFNLNAVIHYIAVRAGPSNRKRRGIGMGGEG